MMDDFEHSPEGQRLSELRKQLRQEKREAREEIQRLEILVERLTGKIELVSDQIKDLYRDDEWYDSDY